MMLLTRKISEKISLQELEIQFGLVPAQEPNFFREWLSRETISELIAEAVMISGVGNQGISFISEGRVIKKYP